MSIEQKINTKLQSHPRIKKAAKRAYQRVMAAISSEQRIQGNIVCITPQDDCEYFYGYYDKSPWSMDGRYLLVMRAKDTTSSAAYSSQLDVCLIDTQQKNKIIKVAESNCWNTQQGCLAQWLGPDFKTRIIYNDFRNGSYCSAIFNVIEFHEEAALNFPIYEVTHDGKTGFSLDFARLNSLRPGYGYCNIADKTRNKKVPDGYCLWKIDLTTNDVQGLLKYTDLIDFEHRPEMDDAFHKINHIMTSPNDKRLMFLHRWIKGTRKYSRLITCSLNGTNLYNLSDDDLVSHSFWKNDNEIISFLNKKEMGQHYYLLVDKTEEFRMLWPEIDFDGHPSYSPNGKQIVTDRYPDKSRIQSIFVGNESMMAIEAKVFSSFKYDGDVRCDLHPRWNRIGTQVCFDATPDGKRRLYVLTIHNQQPVRLDNDPLVSVVMPSYKRKESVQRAVKSVLEQTYSNIELCLVSDNTPGDEYDRYLETMTQAFNDPRLHLIRPPCHRNGAAARNYGIRHSSGDYIAFLDDDDFWLSGKIENQVKVLNNLDESWGGVTCGRIYFRDKEITRVSSEYSSGFICRDILERAMEVFTGTLLIRRSVFHDVGLFDEELTRHQDLQILARISYKYKLQLVKEHYLCIDNTDSLNRPSASKLEKIKEDFFSSVNDIFSKYNALERRRIKGVHQGEVLFLALREKNIFLAIKYFMALLVKPDALLCIGKRVKCRRYESRQKYDLLESKHFDELQSWLTSNTNG